LTISDEPQFPSIPSIGDVVTRKDNMKEFKTTVLKCIGCGHKKNRSFQEGDFVFKKFEEEECEKCGIHEYTIVEIFAVYKKEERRKKKQEKTEKKR
jgi:hypothetical protein